MALFAAGLLYLPVWCGSQGLQHSRQVCRGDSGSVAAPLTTYPPTPCCRCHAGAWSRSCGGHQRHRRRELLRPGSGLLHGYAGGPGEKRVGMQQTACVARVCGQQAGIPCCALVDCACALGSLCWSVISHARPKLLCAPWQTASPYSGSGFSYQVCSQVSVRVGRNARGQAQGGPNSGSAASQAGVIKLHCLGPGDFAPPPLSMCGPPVQQQHTHWASLPAVCAVRVLLPLQWHHRHVLRHGTVQRQLCGRLLHCPVWRGWPAARL